jgi:predicted nucleic acid-binding protein
VKVVDASIISAFILKEPDWEELANIVSKATTIDHAMKETLNAIWKAYEKGYISREDAETKGKALIRLFDSNLEVIDEAQVIQEAFKIALSKNTTIYDSLYIALAKLTSTKLYTLDKKQAQKSQDIVEVELLK